ncbi:MAG: diguanylate cyclase [Lachnospiraceae bacterium]|nr:diguanylate cyclase [Lachnospiraceae bacterium]
MDQNAEILLQYLKNMLYHPDQAQLDLSELSPDFHTLGLGMKFLNDCIQEKRAFENDLARGILSHEPPGPDNALAHSSKMLQASLRHLQWQTRQVAKGDYSQRVDFMGEFSQDFNTMITQLAERRDNLIAEKKKIEEKNREARKNLELMLALANYTNYMIFIFAEPSRKVIFMNRIAQYLQTANPEEFQLLETQLQSHPSHAPESSEIWESQIPVSGSICSYYTIESFPISWENELATAHIVIDDTERRKKEHLIYTLAYIDPLTGLPNRRFAMDQMEGWIQNGIPFLLSFIDVDYLKYCNDTFGHGTGDQYLKDTAGLLKTMHGNLCRIGGDEFYLLSPDMDLETHDHTLSSLRDLFLSQKDVSYPKSFSFATVAVPSSPEKPLSAYIQQADEKLRTYKAAHRKDLSDLVYRDDRI